MSECRFVAVIVVVGCVFFFFFFLISPRVFPRFFFFFLPFCAWVYMPYTLIRSLFVGVS